MIILTWNKKVRWKLPTTFGKYTYYYLTFIVLVVIVVMITLQGWVLYRTQSNFIVICQTQIQGFKLFLKNSNQSGIVFICIHKSVCLNCKNLLFYIVLIHPNTFLKGRAYIDQMGRKEWKEMKVEKGLGLDTPFKPRYYQTY